MEAQTLQKNEITVFVKVLFEVTGQELNRGTMAEALTVLNILAESKGLRVLVFRTSDLALSGGNVP